MFARLKNHAEAIEGEIQSLEKSLEMKTKMFFSIVNSEVSETSVEYMKKLIEELEEMDISMSKLLDVSKVINSNGEIQLRNTEEKILTMGDQLNRMEEHLAEFGYVKCEIIKEDANYSTGDYSGLSE